jgi:hypothetical protein
MIGAGTGTRRTVLVGRQLAVAVFVQLQQGERSIGDFNSGEDAVAIGIQRGHDGRDGRMKVPPVRAGRRTIRGAIGRAVRSPGLWRGAVLLSITLRPWRRWPMGPEFVRS